MDDIAKVKVTEKQKALWMQNPTVKLLKSVGRLNENGTNTNIRFTIKSLKRCSVPIMLKYAKLVILFSLSSVGIQTTLVCYLQQSRS